MDDHDQALAWAQANPQDPRAQDVMAKAWAAKNPNDPRAAQIMAKFAGQPQQNTQSGSLIDAYKSGGLSKAYDTLKANVGAYDQFQNQNPIQSHGPMDTLMKMGVTPGAGLAAGATDGLGAIGKASVNAGSAGLTKYLSNLVSGNPDRTQGVAFNTALGGGVSLGADALASGGSKLGDYLMQKAAGMKKYIPGVGTEMANQGMIGTKGMMRGQVGNAIDDLAESAAGQVKSIPGTVSSAEAAAPVSKYAASQKVGDILPGHSTNDYANATQRAEEIAGRGDVSPTDAWKLAQAAGKAGYRNQRALQSEAAYLAQLEQQGYSGALKEAYTKANPGASDLPDTFSSMSKLYKAKSALDAPTSIPASYALPVLLGGAAGYGADHNITGALKGAALGAGVKSGLFSSVAGRGANAVGNAAEAVSDPAVLQALFGVSNASSVK